MSNRFFIIVLVLLVGIFGFITLTKDDGESNQQQVAVEPTSHVQGEGTTGVTLVEYGDFQCPACAAFFPLVQQVKQEYGDKITFQFRHFPLVQIHRHALLSSKAAEAAGNQGKFFEMHDLLYQSQSSWTSLDDPTDTYVSFAQQLELDVEKFRSDMFSTAVNDKILADIQAANEVGATSTPTFVINGEKLDPNPGSLEEFKTVIDAAIAQQENQ